MVRVKTKSWYDPGKDPREGGGRGVMWRTTRSDGSRLSVKGKVSFAGTVRIYVTPGFGDDKDMCRGGKTA